MNRYRVEIEHRTETGAVETLVDVVEADTSAGARTLVRRDYADLSIVSILTAPPEPVR